MPRRLMLLFAALFGGYVACDYKIRDILPLGYEMFEIACSDGVDNDGNGLVDCDDPGCAFTSGFCGERIDNAPLPQEPEDQYHLCFDQFDNDGNGQFDCGDRKCQAIAETCCLREFTDAACKDGLDNDGNGFIDCADFGCSRGPYVTVCGRSEYRDASNRRADCSDGFDRDGDGLVDCADPDCLGVRFFDEGRPDCPTALENTIAACSNRIDDDGDGFIDCDDEDCRAVPEICLPRGEENTLARCTDGIDNDGNGFIDCADFSCSRTGPPEVVALCAERAENTLERCTDGIDNDGNGFTDCADFSCSRNGPPEVVALCAERAENTFEKCTDGIDNDGNGFADCADFSCSQPRFADIELDPRLAVACDESGGLLSDIDRRRLGIPTADELCSNDPRDLDPSLSPAERARIRIEVGDDDRDGFIDCDDWNCNYNPLVTVCRTGKTICE